MAFYVLYRYGLRHMGVAEMPSVSDKQRKFMAAAANNPEFAKKAGIPQSVAEEFHAADKAKKKPKDYEKLYKKD